MFDSIDTAGTGLHTYQVWLDAVANNIANANDISATNAQAFRAQYVVAQPLGADGEGIGTGVDPTQVVEAKGNGILAYDPTHPLADANGYVRRANVDLPEQMGDLIAAERAYQANATTVDRAKDAYEAAIAIGKGL